MAAIPSQFICPVTRRPLNNPITLDCGHTIDESVLVSLQQTTRCLLGHCDRKIETYLLNHELRNSLDRWLRANRMTPVASNDVAWALLYPHLLEVPSCYGQIASYLRYIRTAGLVHDVALDLMNHIRTERIEHNLQPVGHYLAPPERMILEQIICEYKTLLVREST